MLPRCSAPQQKAKPGHATGTWNILRRRRSGDGQADRRDRPQSRGLRSPGKPTNIPTCIRAWPARPRGGLRRDRRLVRDPGQGGKSHAGRFQKALDTLGEVSKLSDVSRIMTVTTRGISHSRATLCPPKAAWAPVPPPHGLAGAPISMIGERSKPKCGASSTSVMDVAAVSICAIPFRACSTDRRHADRRTRSRARRKQRRRGRMHALRHVLHDEMSLCAAARIRSDFPHLMLRYRAAEATAKASAAFAEDSSPRPTATAAGPLYVAAGQLGVDKRNTLTPAEWKSGGIDRDAELQTSRSHLLSARAEANQSRTKTAPRFGRKAVLYATCFVNYNKPRSAGRARRARMHIGVETEVAYPGCCGMPISNRRICETSRKRRARSRESQLDRGRLRSSRWSPSAR